MGSKGSSPPAAPAATFTPVQQTTPQPIERSAVTQEARDRAAGNKSADLLASASSEATPAKQAAMMGTA